MREYGYTDRQTSCDPSGTGTISLGMTIAGLNHLDRTGVRGQIINAVRAALEQGRAMDAEMSVEKEQYILIVP
ncbi:MULTISPECIES: pyrroline-5-carboxylate reductase dimerization domain-containing protein [unclassified Desulfovibrio]|uniref:pyrroline-5-carboxylate reductase dimerization domain-containing protein n=1 Tax=unclassified Desulfovibrio TaxID=2593640 RepID=UPI002FD9DD8A